MFSSTVQSRKTLSPVSKRMRHSMLVALTILSCSGCRAPWRMTGDDSSSPNFDRLIQIEQQNDGRGLSRQTESPRADSRRPGIFASQSSDRFTPVEDFQSSPSSSMADSDSTPSYDEQDLLARTEKALKYRLADKHDAQVASSNRESEVRNASKAMSGNTQLTTPDADEDAVVFHLNDDSEDVDTGARQLASVEPENLEEQTTSPDRYVFSSQDANESKLEPPMRKQPKEVVSASATTADIESAVTTADSTTMGTLTWRMHLRKAIELLGADSSALTSREEHVQHQAVERMLHIALGDVEAALEPIDSLQPGEQDYFRHQFQALHHAIDPEGNPLASRRWSLAMLSQRKASENLKSVSNLEVLNTAFCTEVENFGVIKKFPIYRFSADQEVLLYCELDNFVSEQVKEGYETQLQGMYEIFDTNGRRVADQKLPLDAHVCRNQRRDYYIPYVMYMPRNISDGKYVLRLAIEDLNGKKFGQAELEFEIQN